MELSTKGIVLNAINYSETSVIVHVYTLDYGLRSFIAKGVRTAKKNKSLSMAMFQPLTQLELLASTPKRSGLATLKSAKIIHPYTSIPTNMIKSSICMFLAEILRSVLKEEEKNEVLYAFLEHAFIWLDTHQKTANFHPFVLIRLTKYLGFYPDTTNRKLQFFDLQNGHFCVSADSTDCVGGEAISLLKSYLGMKFDEVQEISVNAQQRRELLLLLMRYYQIHVQGFKAPKSLAVLYEVFKQ